MKKLLKDEFPELFNEIDIEKTKEFFPDINLDKIYSYSSKIVYWVCDFGKNHSYPMQIKKKTAGHKCPYCQNKKILPGFNDLQTRYPNIAKDFCSELNGITPDKLMPYNKTKYKWKCPECGLIYECSSKERVSPSFLYKCPCCSGHKVFLGINDLETWCKKNNRLDILEEWDNDRNKIKPSEITPNSTKLIFWKCKYCGHIYKKSPNNRMYSGCNNCRIDRLKISSYLVRENKSYQLGNTILNKSPENFLQIDFFNIIRNFDYINLHKMPVYSNKKIFWICNNCNKSFFMSPAHKILSNESCSLCYKHSSAPELLCLHYFHKYLDDNISSCIKIDNWEADIFSELYKTCCEYDGVKYHNENDKNNNRKESIKNNLFISKGYKVFRIKEALVPKQDIKTNNMNTYYISNKYDNKYFSRLQEILTDIFNTILNKNNFYNFEDMKLIYNKIKQDYQYVFNTDNIAYKGIIKSYGNSEYSKLNKCILHDIIDYSKNHEDNEIQNYIMEKYNKYKDSDLVKESILCLS